MLEFQQSGWLAKYIDLNTEMRKKASNAFERDFFKLLNNAVFGKYINDIACHCHTNIVLYVLILISRENNGMC